MGEAYNRVVSICLNSIRNSNKDCVLISKTRMTIEIMTWHKSLYQSIFKRTSTFTLTCILGAVFFERAFAQGTDFLWLKMNSGKLYPDVRKRWDAIVEAGDDDDDDDE